MIVGIHHPSLANAEQVRKIKAKVIMCSTRYIPCHVRFLRIAPSILLLGGKNGRKRRLL